MGKINITYRTKKLKKLCSEPKEAKKELGEKVGRCLMRRITELEAFENLEMVPIFLPWRREKLLGYTDIWSVRLDSNFRIEFKALDLNNDLRLIKNIEIVEVSKHYA